MKNQIPFIELNNGELETNQGNTIRLEIPDPELLAFIQTACNNYYATNIELEQLQKKNIK